MNILKRRKALRALGQYPPADSREVTETLVPYADRLQLNLTDDEIQFSQQCSDNQQVIGQTSFFRPYRYGIPFENILRIKKLPGQVVLYLHTGHIVRFYEDRETWEIENRLDTSEPCTLTIWWWNLHGRLISGWQDLAYYFNHKKYSGYTA